MKIGIVGSRKFPQLNLVKWFVDELPKGCIVVSGGARGVDTAAVQAAKSRGLETIVHLPDLSGCKERIDYTRRYYARNQLIADDVSFLVAFTEKDRGGTWDTIKRVRQLKKPVKVIRPNERFPAEVEEQKEDDSAQTDTPKNRRAAGREKGKGPFHLKRISIGSCALNLKRYLSTEEYADLVNEKDHAPEKMAGRMLPQFIDYFHKNENFGIIHAITQPPKSLRRGDKPHPMDFVCRGIEKDLGIPFVEMFKPWDKRRRGCFASRPEIEIMDTVKPYVGKVVFVLDDVSTTNYTLQTAVRSLMSIGIHSHGLCFLVFA